MAFKFTRISKSFVDWSKEEENINLAAVINAILCLLDKDYKTEMSIFHLHKAIKARGVPCVRSMLDLALQCVSNAMGFLGGDKKVLKMMEQKKHVKNQELILARFLMKDRVTFAVIEKKKKEFIAAKKMKELRQRNIELISELNDKNYSIDEKERELALLEQKNQEMSERNKKLAIELSEAKKEIDQLKKDLRQESANCQILKSRLEKNDRNSKFLSQLEALNQSGKAN